MAKSRWNVNYTDDSTKLFGSPGQGREKWKVEERSLYDRWRRMMDRCYDPKNPKYKTYGAKGIYVEEYLRVFSNYYNYVISMSDFYKILDNLYGRDSTVYEIDKDINGGNYIRNNLCILSRSENSKENYSRNGNPSLGVYSKIYTRERSNKIALAKGKKCWYFNKAGDKVEAIGYNDMARLLGDTKYRSTIRKSCISKNPVSRGPLKGMQFYSE